MKELHAGFSAIVLGAAAGGGFPQWNCGCGLCALARAGDPRVRAATQASVAVSANQKDWLLIGASPDLGQQISRTRALWPRPGGRDSPIKGVVLVGGDIDAIAGLLVLRERQPFTIYAPRRVMEILAANSVFGVLDPSIVRMVEVKPLEPIPCGLDLTLTLLPMPGKPPLYLEARDGIGAEPTFAALIQSNGHGMIIAPACADITKNVVQQLRRADVIFFDGTLFTDDEMIVAGLGTKTGRRMGHVSVSGPDGTIARLGDLPVRRVLLHINNSNPILLDDSPERRAVEAAGFEVAYDGMEIHL